MWQPDRFGIWVAVGATRLALPGLSGEQSAGLGRSSDHGAGPRWPVGSQEYMIMSFAPTHRDALALNSLPALAGLRVFSWGAGRSGLDRIRRSPGTGRPGRRSASAHSPFPQLVRAVLQDRGAGAGQQTPCTPRSRAPPRTRCPPDSPNSPACICRLSAGRGRPGDGGPARWSGQQFLNRGLQVGQRLAIEPGAIGDPCHA